MRTLIRGPIVAALLLATLAGGAGAAYAGTPDNGGKAVGHATTTPGKAKGHTPAPTPDPTPTPDPVPTTYTRQTVRTMIAPSGDRVVAWCDPGDTVTGGSVDVNGAGTWVITTQGVNTYTADPGYAATVLPDMLNGTVNEDQVTVVVHATCLHTPAVAS